MFNDFDRIVRPNGKVIYNFSYSQFDTDLPYRLVMDICNNTEWTLADTIIWKKDNCTPINTSPRQLSRIWEFVWVFCRKTEKDTFTTNREGEIGENGQLYYGSLPNMISAPNNDGCNDLNKATFSTKFISQLLNLYVKDGETVYDPFMGTGTTAVACKKRGGGISCIGSELSEKQVKFAEDRLKKTIIPKKWFDWE